MIQIVATATIDFSLIQTWLPIQSEGSRLLGQYFTRVLLMAVGVVTIASRTQLFFCAEMQH